MAGFFIFDFSVFLIISRRFFIILFPFIQVFFSAKSYFVAFHNENNYISPLFCSSAPGFLPLLTKIKMCAII